MHTGDTSELDVVIAAYNAEGTISRAVKSAFASGASKVIVVDDGSTDETAAQALTAGAHCFSQPNSGAAVARLAGARHVTSRYLVFLDADDQLIPVGVRGSIETLEKNPELSVAAGTVVGMGTDGQRRNFPIRYSPVDTESLLIKGYAPWPPCAAVIVTEKYVRAQEIEPSKLNPSFAEDYELLIRLSMVGGVSVRVDNSCLYSLAGGKSVTSAGAALEAKEAVRAYYARHLGIAVELMNEKEQKRAAQVRVARAHWASGRRLAAARLMLSWVSADPGLALKKMVTKPWLRN